MTELLPDWDDRIPWRHQAGTVAATEVLKGSPRTGLSVVVAHAPTKPTHGDLDALWRLRAGKTADPVLVTVEYTDHDQRRMALLGLTQDAVAVDRVDYSLAERLIEHALELDSLVTLHTDVRRRLQTIRGGVGPGFRNEGLFATHVLEQQPQRADWTDLCTRAEPLLSARGEPLLTGLGYTIEVVPDGVILRDATVGNRHAAAVLLAGDESFDNPLSRFHGSNAVTHGLALARREGVDWLIVLGGSVARLFPSDPDVGVGRKGQSQTFAEIDLGMLTDERAGYLTLLFAPDALANDGAVAHLLKDSTKYATGLSERLRDRIYEDVIPNLAVAVADRHKIAELPREDQRAALDEAYHQTMIILFRLLFVAYAEDRGLLPLDSNATYAANALKTLGQRILENLEQGFSTTSRSRWNDLTQIWQVIDAGDLEGMGVPAYNGGLFSADPAKNPSGAATYSLGLTDDAVGPVLRGLLIDQTVDGVPGMVDFRSLDVREFGTIYEGLLESGLDIAERNLCLDENDHYVPAGGGDLVVVPAGTVYFHSRSGSRKATGSYFTKPFAVQHLLDSALEPAITEHLERVAGLVGSDRHQDAARALFNFRVADLSMGSAHFLVAAIDRIEARFSAFLAQHPLPEVAVELHSLRTAAADHLNIDTADAGIDDGMLLRRQIARRCIYGSDVNEIAVELARLAVWIHTFVPGLPLSFLNHGLIHGNSLTGVGTIDEIIEALAEAERRELPKSAQTGGAITTLDIAIDDFLDRAAMSLADLGALAEASIADVDAASEFQSRIDQALAPLSGLCDLITGERATRHLPRDDPARIRLTDSPGLFTATDGESLEAAILIHPQLPAAQVVASNVQAAHFPLRYPEVFRRERPGFDVIVGNPPWEKMKVEEHAWWGTRFPGLRSLSQQDKNQAIAEYRSTRPDLVVQFESDLAHAKAAAGILTAGPYPGIGATDVDLYAAFCWRFWREVRDEGRIGVVLPRSAMSGAATEDWRRSILLGGSIEDLTTLTNTGRWAFDMEPRYTIALVTLHKGGAKHSVNLRGPFESAASYEAGMALGADAVASVIAARVLSWSDSAAVPLIPAEVLDLYAAMRASPPLGASVGTWRFRPYVELHTTKEKRFYDFDLASPDPAHSLPVWTGGTFNLWSVGSGDPYAWANPDEIRQLLLVKRINGARSKASAFHEMPQGWLQDPSTLPMLHPRIAFRDVCRATDSRTMICALIPPGVVLVHKAPYLLRQSGSEGDEAYLLGVLSSLPFDWFARRHVELAMTYELLNSFPVPRIDSATGRPLRASGVDETGPDLRAVRDRVAAIAGRLAAVDDRYADWAAAVGVEFGSVDTDEERNDLIAELDALVCLLFGLTPVLIERLFATFHRGWRYESRLSLTLAHFRKWQIALSSA